MIVKIHDLIFAKIHQYVELIYLLIAIKFISAFPDWDKEVEISMTNGS